MGTRSWVLAAGLLLGPALVHAQNNAFTYQGRLTSDALAADGSYDFEFRLFDALADGNQQGSTLSVPGVAVSGGVFTVGLNFGAVFDGTPRFLEIAVRTVGGGAFTPLAPRQRITSSPYAIRAATAGNAVNLGGLAASQYVLTSDARLSDARDPLPGSAHYVQNGTSPQAASFNISGGGAAAGTLSGGTVNAGNQYNLGGARILSSPGSANLFLGNEAGAQNSTGQQNTYVGFEAGELNATGTRNTFVGTSAGHATTAGANTFVGAYAGVNATAATSNVFVGNSAGNGNTTGSQNVFVGAATAQDSISTADDNVLVGFSAGRANRGAANTFVGKDAGRANENGQLNVFAGWQAGLDNTSGSSNVFLGYAAGESNTTGGGNTLVGAAVDVGAGNLTNAAAIGAGAIAHASDTIVLGRSLGQDSVHIWGVLRVGLEGAGSLEVCRNANVRLSTCSSSLRYKSDVAPFTRGLDLVSRLRPIRFRWRDSGLMDVGFAAEDVERIEPLLATYGDDGRLEGVKYKQLTAVLATAIQELRRENETLRAQVARQRQETALLRSAMCRAGLLESCE